MIYQFQRLGVLFLVSEYPPEKVPQQLAFLLLARCRQSQSFFPLSTMNSGKEIVFFMRHNFTYVALLRFKKDHCYNT